MKADHSLNDSNESDESKSINRASSFTGLGNIEKPIQINRENLKSFIFDNMK